MIIDSVLIGLRRVLFVTTNVKFSRKCLLLLAVMRSQNFHNARVQILSQK